MLEDRILIWKFKCGSREALCRIYEKYKIDMLKLATVLLNDVSDAEDTVHDVFVSLLESSEKIKLNGNFKSYLSTCVANRARNKNRSKQGVFCLAHLNIWHPNRPWWPRNGDSLSKKARFRACAKGHLT